MQEFLIFFAPLLVVVLSLIGLFIWGANTKTFGKNK